MKSEKFIGWNYNYGDRELIHVRLASGSGYLFGILFGKFKEYMEKVGEKVHQRIEKIVIPQNATADKFESMTDYLKFRLCQIAVKRVHNSLDIDPATKNMLQ